MFLSENKTRTGPAAENSIDISLLNSQTAKNMLSCYEKQSNTRKCHILFLNKALAQVPWSCTVKMNTLYLIYKIVTTDCKQNY